MRATEIPEWILIFEFERSDSDVRRQEEARMAKQGCSFQETEVRRILQLLATTEMSIGEIAQRAGCSRGAIVSINRRFQVRDYAGRRSSWDVLPAYGGRQGVARA